MFKKIKNYFSLKRRIQIEILETLCTMCFCFSYDNRNPYYRHMMDHIDELKYLSEELKHGKIFY